MKSVIRHIVLLNQYYPPDLAPTGVMLAGVVEEFISRGVQVTVICSEGSHTNAATEAEIPSKQDGVHVLRVGGFQFCQESIFGKFANYVSYYLGTIWKLFRLESVPDRIVAMTTPPFLSIPARAISALKGGDHAHWVMDVYPDVLVASGGIREGGMISRVLAGMTRWGYGGSRCAGIVTLGPDMAKRLEVYVDPRQEVRWVPLWGSSLSSQNRQGGMGEYGWEDTRKSERLRHQRGWCDDDLVVMYSGNFGRGHSFGVILHAAKNCATMKSQRGGESGFIRFVFFGRGKRKEEVREFAEKHKECKIELYDYHDASALTEHLQSADLQLVSLNKDWTGTMVPSKFQGIFGVGRPVLFVGSRESSVAKWICESGGGWVVEQGDLPGFLNVIAEARCDKERKRRGEAAARFAEKHFSKKINTGRLANMFGGEERCNYDEELPELPEM